MSHVVELACKDAPMSPGPTKPLADIPCGCFSETVKLGFVFGL